MTTSPDINIDGDDAAYRYLIITNISKKPNIKALICSAAAHNFVPLLVAEPNITESDCSLTKPSRSTSITTTTSTRYQVVDDLITEEGDEEDDFVASRRFIDVFRCENMEELVQFLASRLVTIVGIEIMDSAESIMADNALSTLSRVAFFPGNEGTVSKESR